MPKGRQLVICMSCGLNGPTSIEDVIPKWARNALDPTSSVTVRTEPGDSTARMQHLVVTLHGKVCEACNNGWSTTWRRRSSRPARERKPETHSSPPMPQL